MTPAKPYVLYMPVIGLALLLSSCSTEQSVPRGSTRSDDAGGIRPDLRIEWDHNSLVFESGHQVTPTIGRPQTFYVRSPLESSPLRDSGFLVVKRTFRHRGSVITLEVSVLARGESLVVTLEENGQSFGDVIEFMSLLQGDVQIAGKDYVVTVSPLDVNLKPDDYPAVLNRVEACLDSAWFTINVTEKERSSTPGMLLPR
jgi:hypothetical protein